MAPKKRKNEAVDNVEVPPTKTTGRGKRMVEETASSSRPSRTAPAGSNSNTPRSTRSSHSGSGPSSKPGTNGKAPSNSKFSGSRSSSKAATKGKKPPNSKSKQGNNQQQNTFSVDVPTKSTNRDTGDREDDHEHADGPSYWLMKAEPDSRIEKGKDVKFSIDDLKAATAPEPWDGVRNAVARNNMRLMMKGDIAFFYHSNCKVPGIVGIMEIVQEHSIDESAFNPEHPYYDEKSDREKPKWCVVHVEFRQKFPEIVKLKELQKYAKPGGVLENLQTLKTTRLSVSKVSKREWDFIMSLVDSEDVAAAAAQHQPQMVA
ncbi:hypothetical protein P7C71_g647, partial [Lecanoromycetidae sp. Uapishka_2]